jgi:hypothetical protein
MEARLMQQSLSVRAVLRRTFGIYGDRRAPILSVGLLLAGLVALSDTRARGSTGVGILLLVIFVVVGGLSVGTLVLVVADVFEGGPRRNAAALLRDSWSALGWLLLALLVAGLAIGLVSSVGSIVGLGLIVGAALSSHGDSSAVILGVAALSILSVVPELYLLTSWSVLAAVAVIERPGGLRSLGRSRDLVRGNRWRAFALMLVLSLALGIAAGVDRSASTAGSGIGIVVGLLVASVIAPIPVLATTVLYFELRRTESAPAAMDPTPPGAALQ